MAISEQMQNNILSRVLTDISLLSSVNKRKFEREQFDKWIEEFASLDIVDSISIIEEVFKEQFISVEKACIENYDYIRLTGLGNLRTNQARQEILEHLKEHGHTHKEDVRPIIEKYIKDKKNTQKHNRPIVELNITLKLNEK